MSTSNFANKQEENHYREQEQRVIKRLNLLKEDSDLTERMTLAKYVTDIEKLMLTETTELYQASSEAITPMNLPDFVANLIKQSQAIAELATNRSPKWSFDHIDAFIKDMSKITDFGDATFKQNFVFVVKLVAETRERRDMVALADLFYGEIPSVLRSLKAAQRQVAASPKAGRGGRGATAGKKK